LEVEKINEEKGEEDYDMYEMFVFSWNMAVKLATWMEKVTVKIYFLMLK
jgi:hypothetical protein